MQKDTIYLDEPGTMNYLLYDREKVETLELNPTNFFRNYNSSRGKRIYLAGPMSNQAHWNYPAFMKAANRLRTLGYEVFNPAESALGLGYEKPFYLREDFKWIAANAEGIAVLPYWFYSPGARAEVYLAQALGIPIISTDDDSFGKEFPWEDINPYIFNGDKQWNFPAQMLEDPVPLKVALSGKMKAGKDTIGEELRRATFVPKASFAAPLKQGCEVFGIGVSEETKDRVVLQDIGEYFTQRNPRHWVNLLHQNYVGLHETGIIITDLRNDGELDWCKEQGITTVRLQVSPETQIARGAEADRLDHPTETRMDTREDEFDIVIEEGITIEDAVETILSNTGSKERLAQLAMSQVLRIASTRKGHYGT